MQGSRRSTSWTTPEITEQKPDERVAWRNTDGKDNTGVVTFRRLDDARTRVMVQMDFVPEGLGDSHLERFKQLIESRGAETGGWCAEVNRRNEI